jgi:acyl-CoA thioester hydrolase
MSNFPVKLKLRLDWSEIDMFGHVNNVAYIKYMQASRVHYWEVATKTLLFSGMKLGPVLRSVTCEFIRPLFYPGDIIVQASIEFIKNTSFGMHHQILNDKGELVAEAHEVIVMFNFEANEKMTIPVMFRDAVNQLEG